MRAWSLQRKHALILALALVAAMTYGKAALGSVALGGGIQIVNLRALETGVAGMLGLASSGRHGGRLGVMTVLVHLRWVILLGVVAAVLLLLPVEPIAFVVGLSTLVPALLWHGLQAPEAGTSPEA